MARRSLSSFSCLLDTRGDSDDLASKSAPLLAVGGRRGGVKEAMTFLAVLTFWFPLDGDCIALHVSACVIVSDPLWGLNVLSDLFQGFIASQGQFV